MALAEVPVFIDETKVCSDCDNCLLNNPNVTEGSVSCTVIDRLGNLLTLPKLKIAVSILLQPEGEFRRSDVLQKPEEGDSAEAQGQRFLSVVDFFTTSTLMQGLLVPRGEKGGRTYDLQKSKLPEICAEISSTERSIKETEEAPQGKIEVVYLPTTLEIEQDFPTEDIMDKVEDEVVQMRRPNLKLQTIIDAITQNERPIKYVCPPGETPFFHRVNNLYGNLAQEIDADHHTREEEKRRTVFYLTDEFVELITNHYAESQVGHFTPSQYFDERGNQVWSEIFEYLSGGNGLPLLAKASLADLYTMSKDLKSGRIIPDDSPETVWARVHHVKAAIDDIVRFWRIGNEHKDYNLPGITQWVSTDWKEDASCLGIDPKLFHPERGESTKEAKAVCRDCVVREECLEFAITSSEKFGVWGGLSERERRRLRKARYQVKKKSQTKAVSEK